MASSLKIPNPYPSLPSNPRLPSLLRPKPTLLQFTPRSHPRTLTLFKSDRGEGAVSSTIDFRPIAAPAADGNRCVKVVLLGWLGAEPKHLKRYAEFYHSKGFKTTSFFVPVSEMLWFDLGRFTETRIQRLANEVVSWVAESEEDGRERCLVFHTFSNTGWLVYGKILRHLQRRPDLMMRIKGCVVDSGGDPDINPKVWAAGFAIAILKNRSSAVVYPGAENGEVDPITHLPKLQRKEPGVIETVLLFMLERIFSFFLNLPDVNQRLSKVITSVSKNSPSCPQLYLYSTADKVIHFHSVESFMEEQRRLGKKVESFNFQSSLHVDHFRAFPDLYSSKVSGFLAECLAAVKQV